MRSENQSIKKENKNEDIWKYLPTQKEREAPKTLAEKTQRTAGKNPKSKEAPASKKTAQGKQRARAIV